VVLGPVGELGVMRRLWLEETPIRSGGTITFPLGLAPGHLIEAFSHRVEVLEAIRPDLR
jgi:hypothetical protein